MSLLWSSVLLYLSESLLALLFFFGLVRLMLLLLRPMRRWLSAVTASNEMLVRFALFQVVLVAVWSVLFKLDLKTTLPRAQATALLARGQSLAIAVPAEFLLCGVILFGGVLALRAFAQRLRGGAS